MKAQIPVLKKAYLEEQAVCNDLKVGHKLVQYIKKLRLQLTCHEINYYMLTVDNKIASNDGLCFVSLTN